MPEWSGAQILEHIRPRFEAFTVAGYVLGVAFRELSRPARYRDELGYRSFEALLEAERLGSRMTAHKYAEVVSSFSLEQVKVLGGMEKCYHIVRGVKAENPEADPRMALEPGSRVAGVDVRTSSARQIRDAVRALRQRLRPSGRPDTRPCGARRSGSGRP